MRGLAGDDLQRLRPLGDGGEGRSFQSAVRRFPAGGGVNHEAYGDELYQALRSRTTVAPLTAREPSITIEDAYRISLRLRDRRISDGESVIGKKIGVTSKPVQNALGVHQPD